MCHIDTKRNSGIYFKVSEQDRDLIEQKKKLAGINNMSAYIRKMCIDGYTLNLDIPELKEISSMMAKTGGNLNQIARHLNSGGNIYGDEFAGIQENFNFIREQFGKILMSLSKLK